MGELPVATHSPDRQTAKQSPTRRRDEAAINATPAAPWRGRPSVAEAAPILVGWPGLSAIRVHATAGFRVG